MVFQFKMAAAKIIGAVVASFAVAYVCDTLIADQKVFGGMFLQFLSDSHSLINEKLRLQQE